MSGTPPTAEEIAAALPGEVTMTQLVQALITIGVPSSISAWVTEVQLGPKEIAVEVATNLARSRLRVTMRVDDSRPVQWDEIGAKL